MRSDDIIKLVKAGYIIIRQIDKPRLRIETAVFKDGKIRWELFREYPDSETLNEDLNCYLKSNKIILD